MTTTPKTDTEALERFRALSARIEAANARMSAMQRGLEAAARTAGLREGFGMFDPVGLHLPSLCVIEGAWTIICSQMEMTSEDFVAAVAALEIEIGPKIDELEQLAERTQAAIRALQAEAGG